MTAAETILKLSKELELHTVELRREIHANPELAFQERETSALVCRELERIGIPYEKSPVEPGIIATIDSGKKGRFLMLRADMDALPIPEETGLPFCSANENTMHACGHDVHTANLLTVGEILFRMKEAWRGRVKLVFQPAEERGGGGREMIKAGLFDEIPDACLAMHTATEEAGQLQIGTGSVSAFSDGCELTIHGQATHSSKPQTGIDAVQIAGAVIGAMYQIPSKYINPKEQSTLNIGLLSGGLASNIVPDTVSMRLMMRNAAKEARAVMFEKIEQIAGGICSAFGGSCTVEFHEGYAAVQNDKALSAFVAGLAEENRDMLYEGLKVPENYLMTGDLLTLGAEDFGFYSQKAPSCFIRIGTGDFAPAHSQKFLVDEDYIKLFTRLMSLAAVEFLQNS